MTTVGTGRPPSMLLAFRAENVRSFREEFELSMIATRIGRSDVARTIRWWGGGDTVDVLPAAGIFGSNASGKSNVLHAMGDLGGYVYGSFFPDRPANLKRHQPFRLDSGSAASPSRYEIDVVINGIRYDYGLQLDDQRVVHEVARHYPMGRARLLFERDGDDLRLGPDARKIGRDLVRLVRPDALFLSTVGALQDSTASNEQPALDHLHRWITTNFALAHAGNRDSRLMYTAQNLTEPGVRDRLLELIRAADLGIVDVRRRTAPQEVVEQYQKVAQAVMEATGSEHFDPDSIADGLARVEFEHRGVESAFFPPDVESLGTLVWVGLIGPVVDALSTGNVLLADELDSSLHPLLVERLIGLFQDPDSNPHGAQLIFNAHDPGLLGSSRGDGVLGRDQVWFTEKQYDGATTLTPLSDYQPRREEDVAGRYRAGRYGAVPILSDAEFARAAERILAGSNA